MVELRKKLTETQFRLLVSAQLKYDRALEDAQSFADELNTIRSLVLDAHDIDVESESWLDASTQELVLEREEPEPSPEHD